MASRSDARRTWRLAAAGYLAAALLSSIPASGQTPPLPPVGSDVVYLKNGGLVRGTVIDVIPGQAARLQLVTGEISTIPWSAIDHVATGATAAASARAAEPSPSGPSAEPPSAEAPASGVPVATLPSKPRDESPPSGATQMRLHIDSPREVQVFGRSKVGDADWAPVCRGACDQAVPLDWQYEIRGEGIKDSKAFTLTSATGSSTVVVVDPASKGMFVLGIVSLAVGLNASIVGASLMLAGAELTNTSSATVNDNGITTSNVGTGHDLVAVGTIVTVVGVAALVGGSLATFNNLRTGAKLSAPGDTGARVVLPRFESAREAPRLPAFVGVPLVTFRF